MIRTAEIVAALDGKWNGRFAMVRCPAHDDRSPSLSIAENEDGKTLFRCWGGCPQDLVIDALRSRGLWGDPSSRPIGLFAPSAAERAKKEAQRDAERQRLVNLARKIWATSQPAAGSPVETYLRSRCIDIPVPQSLRFHPDLLHKPTGLRPPCMVAAVQVKDREVCAIHRTFLREDGQGKAGVRDQKMMLGSTTGGAVRLSALADELAVAEGIETALSAMQATGLATWAALSAPGLRSLVLPERVRSVVILADNDTAGDESAKAAAARWTREGRSVRIAKPPSGFKDFNDALREAGHE